MAPNTTVFEVPDGEAGALAVADRMWRLVQEWDPEIRQLAECILRPHVPLHGPEDMLGVFVRFLKKNSTYAQDHVEVEELRSAKAVLRQIAEQGHAFMDCDDYVVTLGVLLTAVGIPVRLVLASDNPEPPHELNHVFLEAHLQGRGWVPVEMLEDRPIGFEWKGFSRVLRYPPEAA